MLSAVRQQHTHKHQRHKVMLHVEHEPAILNAVEKCEGTS